MNSVNGSYSTEVEEFLKPFVLPREKLEQIVERITSAFDRGLHNDPDIFLHSPVKMLPTHLSVVPDGSEVGRFFAIDLGGTNLRFFEIDVVNGQLKPTSLHFKVPEQAMTGEADDLFNFIASCTEKGIKSVGMEGKRIEYLGFTFSFPVNQLALNSGLLMRWTKGFCTAGVEGKDVVLLLRQACERLNLPIDDFVLINDTTGTLLCGAFEDQYARIGVINGTGTNACYVEDLTKVRKWKSPTSHVQVIINTEWGAFGEQEELYDVVTDLDKIIDKESLNPGRQTFEKMLSGLYLGRLVGYLILEMTQHGKLFNGDLPKKLKDPNTFPTSLLSDSYEETLFRRNFQKNFDVKLSAEDYTNLKRICDVISIRSAKLCAAGLVALINRITRKHCVIAADGSMFRKHPKYVEYITSTIRELLPERDFKLILADDGSGKGAALAACVASSDKHKNGTQVLL